MNQPQARSENKQQLWSDRIAAWKDSGLSQRHYCDRHQLTYSTFVYWRGRLKQLNRDNHTAGKVSFLPVKFKQEDQATLILRINDRHSIEIHPGFDPDLLGKVIQAVQKVA
jgi:hypothetical protein